jgi:hypothetical protein
MCSHLNRPRGQLLFYPKLIIVEMFPLVPGKDGKDGVAGKDGSPGDRMVHTRMYTHVHVSKVSRQQA